MSYRRSHATLECGGLRSVWRSCFLSVALVVGTCCAPAPSSAQQVFQRGGLYSFLRTEPNARASGMGGAFVAIQNDAAGMFVNPATLATLDSGETAATFFKHVLDINAGTLAVAVPMEDFGVRDRGVAAFGANYVNYGRFERLDKTGKSLGTFTGFDLALSLAYANDLDSNWSYGVAVKYIANRLDNTGAGAIAFDAGMMYHIPKARTTLGVSALHIGTQLVSVGGVQEALPTDVRLGVSHQLRGLPLLVSFSLNRMLDPVDTFLDRFLNFSAGGEFTFGKIVNVRIGYENQRRRELAPDAQPRVSGFSTGAGVLLGSIRADYALNFYGTLGNLHRVSFQWRL